MSQIVDGYVDDPLRIVLFKFKRYRMTTTPLGLYTLWYGGSIIRMDRDRNVILDRFKQAQENMEAIAS